MKKALAMAAMAAMIAGGAYLWGLAPAVSGGETRTISIYHIHTKESLTVTYMKNGKYIPSAMKKINYILRDWRRNEVITMSPRTIDLMWELHADLGSKRPVHIVSGYRSPKTNAFLKKVGRNVARKSQHMVGKAIDIYFPDVPTEKMRNSALVRQVGGVGYYRSGGGPTGFLHIDSGRVRHWGPAISQRQMARIMRDYKKTVGARLNRKGMKAVPEIELAEADESAKALPSQQEVADNTKARKKPVAVETAYVEDDEELAGMSADAAETSQKKTRPKLAEDETDNQPETAGEAPEGVAQGYPVPKPRPKPIEVLMMAAANMKIEPAAAPPPDQMSASRPSPLEGSQIGTVLTAETLAEVQADPSGKTSLSEELRDGTPEDVPMIQTMVASVTAPDTWWQQPMIFDPVKAVRRDGQPQQFSKSAVSDILPGVRPAQAEPVRRSRTLATAAMAGNAARSGKGDLQVVDREGKGSLPSASLLFQKKAENQN